MIAATFQSLLQAFFTDRLLRQRQASPYTIAGYRESKQLRCICTQIYV
jgi:integrase/recombinase XerD